MRLFALIFGIVAVFWTLGALYSWAMTGADVFTKYEVIVEVEPDDGDPFAGTGLHEDGVAGSEVRVDFRFGLLPATYVPIDRHFISVLTIAGPWWAVFLFFLWRGIRTDNAPRPVGEPNQQTPRPST